MRYIPHTSADIARMLETIGVDATDRLFDTIPASLQLGRDLAVPSAVSERDLLAHMEGLARRNQSDREAVSFLGGGVYRHVRPIAADQLLLRGELYTAYTPYQPEVSQGTLQIIFEFQTMIAQLIGMEVVNASMYDGSTSVAEAALMAARVTRRSRCLVAGTLHPEYREVVETYARAGSLQIETIGVAADGTVDLDAAEAAIGSDTACIIVGYPGFFGTLDDVARAATLAHDHGALLVSTFQDAYAFGLLTPPGELGADIVAGEGQALGVPPSFGGPHLGLFGCHSKHLRKMPGRLAGETVDSRGNRGFVLTMSTREQHIRREKATSNICTNTGLMATAATITMTILGPDGLARIARASHLRAEQTRRAVCALPGFGRRYSAPTFHEFVVTTPVPADRIVAELAAEALAPGIALGAYDEARSHELLIAATELTTDDEIATLTGALARYSP